LLLSKTSHFGKRVKKKNGEEETGVCAEETTSSLVLVSSLLSLVLVS